MASRRFADSRRDLVGVSFTGHTVEQNGELVAPESSDHVLSAQEALEPPGDLLQQLVPDQVAQTVIDDLEPIEVHEEHGEHVVGMAARARDGL